jgi:hypothetical protein
MEAAMGEAKIKRERAAKDSEKRLDEGLKETFPASDASQDTQPGGGITANEPPPAGQKTAR